MGGVITGVLSHVSLITLSKYACVCSEGQGIMKTNLSEETWLVMNLSYHIRYKTLGNHTNSVPRLIYGLISLLVTNLIRRAYM